MTLTTVTLPCVLAKTSILPRYGLSLKRTGEFFSSLDANTSGALDRSEGAAPRAKATNSREGDAARAVYLSLLAADGDEPGAGFFGAVLPAIGRCVSLTEITSKPASSSFASVSSTCAVVSF